MEQKKEIRKPTWRRGPQERTGQSKPWPLRKFRGKTVWDWLHLLSALAIPVVLAGIGFWFTAQQDARQQRIEDQRADVERELAEQRAQDEALEGYLDQMSALVLEDLKDPNVRELMRARTLTVLRRVDPRHKTQVMQFLIETDLVQSVDGKPPVIELAGADLSNADLTYYRLAGERINVYDCDLREPEPYGEIQLCVPSEGDLRGVNLRGANLVGADLSATYLVGADLSGADASHASLAYSILTEANLSSARLIETDLNGAALDRANLDGSYLPRANLSGADGITEEQLEQQTPSNWFKDATMPDGSKHP